MAFAFYHHLLQVNVLQASAWKVVLGLSSVVRGDALYGMPINNRVSNNIACLFVVLIYAM